MREKLKRTLRALAAALCAALAALSLAGTALADGTGTICIANVTFGTTYSAYKFADVTEAASGDYVYTIDEATYEQYQELSGVNDVLAFTKIGEDVYSVVLTGGEDAFADALKAWAGSSDGGAAAVFGDAEAYKLIGDAFTGQAYLAVPFGYYVVLGTTHDGDVTLVSAVTVAADATVFVVDKSMAPSFEAESTDDGGTSLPTSKLKTITGVRRADGTYVTVNGTEASVSAGDTVSYDIKFTATNFVDGKMITKYVIEDELPDGLEFVGMSIISLDTLDNHHDYEVTGYVNGKFTQCGLRGDVEVAETENGFRFTLPWCSKEYGYSYYAQPYIVTISYTAKATEDLELGAAGNVNKAKVTYYTSPYTFTNGQPVADLDQEDEGGELEGSATAYARSLALFVTDELGNPLEGVMLKVASASFDDLGGDGNCYSYSWDGDTEYSELTTDEDGRVVIEGLGYAVLTVAGEAPSGYSLSGESDFSFTVTLTDDGVSVGGDDGAIVVCKTYDGTAFGVDYDGDGTADANFTSPVPAAAVGVVLSGAQLPSTGGAGTVALYAAGGALLAAGLLLFAARRRRDRRGAE